MKMSDFTKNIDIGFKILGLEGFSIRDNIVICVGIIGRCLKSTTNQYKIEIKNAVNTISSMLE